MLKIEIKTSGAAFANEDGEFDVYCGGEEVNRILKKIVKDIRNGYETGSCMDINGNKVGTWKLEN